MRLWFGIKQNEKRLSFLDIELKIVLWNFLTFPKEAFEIIFQSSPQMNEYISILRCFFLSCMFFLEKVIINDYEMEKLWILLCRF